MTFDESRIPWAYLKANYDRWKAEGYWIIGGFWFGFDVTHSWAVGTERFLIAMLEEPEWCEEIYDTYLNLDTETAKGAASLRRRSFVFLLTTCRFTADSVFPSIRRFVSAAFCA